MKNQDKASLPKIQIKQVQVLNRAYTANGSFKQRGSAGFFDTLITLAETTTDTLGSTITGS